MKRNLIYICGLGALVACGSVETEESLKAERDAVQGQIDQNTTKLNEINQKLEDMGVTEDADAYNCMEVTYVDAKKEIFEHYVKIQGKVEAGKMVMVVPEVGGIITSLKVNGREGETIEKGDVIATFDSKLINSNINEIDTQIEVAQKLYDKQKSLYDQGLGNIIQLDQAKGQLDALKQTKNSILTQKGQFTLKAPFTGVIEDVMVVEGQVAAPGTPIIYLVGKKERKVTASISESYLKNLTAGAKVQVDFPALDEKMENLSLTRVGGMVHPVNRTIDIEVDLNDRFTDKHVPNLLANIEVRDIVDSSALTIPSKVVLKGADGSSHVFVLEMNGQASDSITRYDVKKRIVSLGSMYKGKTVVTAGIKPGDMIVDRGSADVYEGSMVVVANGQ